jgi:hypothetical protein
VDEAILSELTAEEARAFIDWAAQRHPALSFRARARHAASAGGREEAAAAVRRAAGAEGGSEVAPLIASLGPEVAPLVVSAGHEVVTDADDAERYRDIIDALVAVALPIRLRVRREEME